MLGIILNLKYLCHYSGKEYYISANIEIKGKLICKSNLFRSYKSNLNKDLNGRVT